MSTTLLVLVMATSASLAMVAAWRVAGRTGNHGWIDTIWSFMVGTVGVVGALAPIVDAGPPTTRQWLVAGMAAVWSARLGSHILTRTLKGGDDPRYVQLRAEWGDQASSRLFWFLQIQAAAAFLLAIAITVASRHPAPDLRAADWLGIAVLILAVGGEAIADRQLARFREDPANKGKVCDIGLWGLTRHPNYFFEWLGWLAYPIIALDLSGNYLFGLLALLGPALMYWLLVHASGIPPTEAHMLRSRGEAFRAYQADVNAFWPGPRRRNSQ